MPRIFPSNITDPVYGLRRIFDAMRHSPLPRMRRRSELNAGVDGNPAASFCRRRRRCHPGPISQLSSTCELHHAVCEIKLRHAHSSRERTSIGFYGIRVVEMNENRKENFESQ